MAFNTNITAGAPPLLWSDVHEAFKKVNENFDILVATVGNGSGLTPIDFGTLDTDVAPSLDNVYRLGNDTHRWRAVYAAGYIPDAVNSGNGLWAGSAQIKGIGAHVDLPPASTIAGSLIIDPDKTFFKIAQVDNGNSVVANSFADTLNLNSGTAIQLVVDSSAESITFNNTGVTSLSGGAGISVSADTGAITVSNTGVRSLSNVSSLPTGRALGAGININASSGDNIKITNTGVLEVQSGFGITVSTDNATGITTVSYNPSAAPSTAFTRFHITGDFAANDILSDTTSDTFNLTQGYGILLSNNPATDTLTITLDQNIDITGSVFGDNTLVMVDAVNNRLYASDGIYGNLTGNVLGNVIGNTTGYHTGDIKGSLFGDDSSLLVDAVNNKIYAGNGFFGNLTGNVTGNVNGNLTGNVTGNVTGNADSATVSSTVNITNTNGLTTVYYPTFVENRTTGQTLRGDVDLTYRTDTNTLTAGTFSGAFSGTLTGNIFTNLIDSSDSSAITITPMAIFQSDVNVENDLNVTQRFTLRGSRVLNLTDLKSIVASSTNFADFQLKIAELV